MSWPAGTTWVVVVQAGHYAVESSIHVAIHYARLLQGPVPAVVDAQIDAWAWGIARGLNVDHRNRLRFVPIPAESVANELFLR